MGKKDEMVSITAKGKVKIRLNSIKRACFNRSLSEMVKNCDEAVKAHPELDVMSFPEWATLSLLMDIYQEYFNNHDYEQSVIMNLTKTEALLLWGAYENYCYSHALFTRTVMLALHQKLC